MCIVYIFLNNINNNITNLKFYIVIRPKRRYVNSLFNNLI